MILFQKHTGRGLKRSRASCKQCDLCCMGEGDCRFLKRPRSAASYKVRFPARGFVWVCSCRGSRDVVAGSLLAGAANGSADQYQVAPVQPNLLGVHNPLPDGTEPECQEACNSRSISQNSWKQGLGQEPVQMATEGWSGLQVFAWHWVGADTDGEWDVSEVQFCPYLSCVRLSSHEKGRALPKQKLSFWDSVPSLEISPLPLKWEICLETCRLNFIWRDYLYMGVKCEFPACICTSKSLAVNCLQKVNKDQSRMLSKWNLLLTSNEYS